MFPYMSHGIEFLLTNFTGKFLFCISMDNLDMFMKGPEFLERFITGNTLNIFFTVCLLVKGQLTFQDKLLATLITNLHAPMSNVHVLLQVPASIKHPGALLTGQSLFLFTLSFLDWCFGLLCGPLLTLRWLYTLPTTSCSSGSRGSGSCGDRGSSPRSPLCNADLLHRLLLFLLPFILSVVIAVICGLFLTLFLFLLTACLKNRSLFGLRRDTLLPFRHI